MRLATACGVVMISGSLAFGADDGAGRLSRDLRDLAASGRPGDPVDIIIQAEGITDELAGTVVRHGGNPRRRLDLIGGLSATVPLSALEDVASVPGVRHISPDRPVMSTVRPISSSEPPSWPQIPGGLQGVDGRGVGVAVIDSGVFDHENLAGAVRARLDFVSTVDGHASNVSPALQDPYGHGTHVAGLIAGRPSGSFSGLAPGAHIVSLRVLDERGQGQTSDVIAALDWCINHAQAYGLRVVNISLGQPVGEPSSSDPLAQAVERAWRAGLVVVASSGNAGMLGSGFGTVSSPGNDPLALTVGAVDDAGTARRSDDSIAFFSSRGPTRFDATVKPDVVAQGVRLASLRVPQSTLDRAMPSARVSDGEATRPDPRFFEMSGSSMAAAVVSGTAALLLQADPSLTPDDVKARLMKRADHQMSGDLYARGAGQVDLPEAMQETARAAHSASPRVQSTDQGVTLVHDAASWGSPQAWSLEQLYGNPSLWGEEDALVQGFFDDPCLTGEGVIWQTMSGTGVIWQTMTAEGVIWQTLTADGVIWQTMAGNGVIWQTMAGQSCPL
jgi:serine protease AprX